MDGSWVGGFFAADGQAARQKRRVLRGSHRPRCPAQARGLRLCPARLAAARAAWGRVRRAIAGSRCRRDREHPIENDEVEFVVLESYQAIITGGCDCQKISFGHKSVLDRVSDLGIVFDDENVHEYCGHMTGDGPDCFKFSGFRSTIVRRMMAINDELKVHGGSRSGPGWLPCFPIKCPLPRSRKKSRAMDCRLGCPAPITCPVKTAARICGR